MNRPDSPSGRLLLFFRKTWHLSAPSHLTPSRGIISNILSHGAAQFGKLRDQISAHNATQVYLLMNDGSGKIIKGDTELPECQISR